LLGTASLGALGLVVGTPAPAQEEDGIPSECVPLQDLVDGHGPTIVTHKGRVSVTDLWIQTQSTNCHALMASEHYRCEPEAGHGWMVQAPCADQSSLVGCVRLSTGDESSHRLRVPIRNGGCCGVVENLLKSKLDFCGQL
jgi:hypothetical protein